MRFSTILVMSPRFFLEITGREDIGGNLKAPSKKENGRKAHWGYLLINDVRPDDIVLHYDHNPRVRSVVGFSLSVGTVRSKMIRWAAQGTSARKKKTKPHWRPGWWLKLRGYTPLRHPLTLAEIRAKGREVLRIQNKWREDAEERSYVPFVLQSGQLRPAQSYLAEIPPDLIGLFPSLREALSGLTPSPTSRARREEFGQRYRWTHSRAPRFTGEPIERDPDVFGRGVGAHQDTQHALARFLIEMNCEPRSPLSGGPQFDVSWERDGIRYVAEVKSLTNRNESRQIRMGLGQLLEYRYDLTRGKQKVRPVLVVEGRPKHRWWVHRCRAAGVTLVWPGRFNALQDSDAPDHDF